MTSLLVLAALAAARDATHGRIDGDVMGSLGAGVTFGARAPSAAFDVRARYLDTAGAFLTYEDGLGGPAEPARALAFGVELRPLFLGRWLTGRESGSAWLDLTVDSFGLELGAAILQPRAGDFGDRVALQAGLALELPILARASGPWLAVHAGGRFSDRALAAHEAPTALEQSVYVTVTLAWHQALGAHAVDAGDLRP